LTDPPAAPDPAADAARRLRLRSVSGARSPPVMINNISDHVSPGLERSNPQWSVLVESEILLDSPHSAE
jgi:hypothetical protein